MAEGLDREALEKHFGAMEPSVVAAIANRAAARVLPMLARSPEKTGWLGNLRGRNEPFGY